MSRGGQQQLQLSRKPGLVTLENSRRTLRDSSHPIPQDLCPFRNPQIIQNGQSTCSAKLPRLLQRGNPSRLVPQGGGGDNLLTIQNSSKPTLLGFHWNNFGSSGIQRRCGHRRRQQDQHGETFLDDLVQRLG